MPPIAELAKELITVYESWDVENVIVPHLHEDFKHYLLPGSMHEGVKNIAEYIPWLLGLKASIQSLKVCTLNSLISSY